MMLSSVSRALPSRPSSPTAKLHQAARRPGRGSVGVVRLDHDDTEGPSARPGAVPTIKHSSQGAH